MGNKPFKIGLRLDQRDQCKAGEVLTGKVYLSVDRLAHVKNFRGIHLQLHGIERSEVAAKPGTLEYDQRRREGRPAVERSTHTLVHADYPLVDLTGITRGQYEYPFELPLRNDFPGSIRCALDGNDRSFCEIKYTLKAYIAYRGEVPSSMSNDQMYDEIVLNMKGAPPQEDAGPRPIRTETEIFPITTCWFWSQGHIALGWGADRSVAAPGENVHVRVWGENQSKLTVEYISVKWMETVTWRTEGTDHGRGSGRSAPQTKRSRRLLAEQRQSVYPHSQWHSTNKSSSDRISGHEALLHDGQQTQQQHPELVSTLRIPQSARETYKGRLLEVKHSLVVCVLTSGGYTSTTPESSFAVRICRAGNRRIAAAPPVDTVPAAEAVPVAPPVVVQGTVEEQPQPVVVEAEALPDDWQPVEADVVSLPLASAVIISDGVDVDTVPRTPVASAPDESLILDVPPPPENSDPATAKAAAAVRPSAAAASSSSSVDQLVNVATECPENLLIVLEDPEWTARIQQMPPRDFTRIVQAAGTSSSTLVARTLALRMGASFQTRHVLACLWNISPGQDRTLLLREVVPLASDLRSKSAMIEEELNQEELMVFRAAANL